MALESAAAAVSAVVLAEATEILTIVTAVLVAAMDSRDFQQVKIFQKHLEIFC